MLTKRTREGLVERESKWLGRLLPRVDLVAPVPANVHPLGNLSGRTDRSLFKLIDVAVLAAEQRIDMMFTSRAAHSHNGPFS